MGVANISGGDARNWVKEEEIPFLEQGCSMSTKVTIECDARFENGVRRALAMMEEMEQLALTAADGQVFDQCEQAVIEKGRHLQAGMLGDAVARRIEAAEKKGRRSGTVRAVAKKKIADPSRENS
jgi:hypothetical protein